MKQSIAGETLIEILVSLTIFAFSFLGLSALQINALEFTNDSEYRQIAAILAFDMGERLRANPEVAREGINGGFHNLAQARASHNGCLGQDGIGNLTNASCTPTQMAEHDFFEWYGLIEGRAATPTQAAIRRLLPSGSGVVCVDSTPNDSSASSTNFACDGATAIAARPLFAVKIFWNERAEVDEDTPDLAETSFAVGVQP